MSVTDFMYISIHSSFHVQGYTLRRLEAFKPLRCCLGEILQEIRSLCLPISTLTKQFFNRNLPLRSHMKDAALLKKEC